MQVLGQHHFLQIGLLPRRSLLLELMALSVLEHLSQQPLQRPNLADSPKRPATKKIGLGFGGGKCDCYEVSKKASSNDRKISCGHAPDLPCKHLTILHGPYADSGGYNSIGTSSINQTSTVDTVCVEVEHTPIWTLTKTHARQTW